MKRRPRRIVNGIVLLDKPADTTSNQALQRVRRLYDAARAGHTGSLDPLATGMLPICLGTATKVCAYLLGARKGYRVTARLGVSTATGDAHGEVVERTAAAVPPVDMVERTLAGFVGEHDQVPPMYSALKYRGERLYRLARQGIEVPREPRRIRIFELRLRRLCGAELGFDAVCSKGAYMRTLVEDIARAMGTLGHVQALRRTSVGPFDETRMLSLPALEARAREGFEALDQCLLPADRALAEWPRVVVPAPLRDPFASGRAVPAAPDWPQGMLRVYTPDGEFLGIGEIAAPGHLAPKRVFAAPRNAG